MNVQELTQTGKTIKEMANIAIQQYSLRDAEIATLGEQYASLKVDGLEDKKGLQVVHEARMVVARKRVGVEKDRVEFKAGALEFGRLIDGEAKRLTKLLAPIEQRLKAQEDTVAAEKEQIRQEAEAARREAFKVRMDKLDAVGARIPTMLVEALDQEEFDAELARATEAHEVRQRELAEETAREEAAIAERKRLDEQAAQARKAEEAKLAAERAELDKQRAEIEADRKRIADEGAEAKRKEKEHADRIEADARAKREADEKVELERIREQEQKAEAERIKKLEEEARPVREKLAAVAVLITEVELPELPNEIDREVRGILVTASLRVVGLAAGLVPDASDDATCQAVTR